MSGQPNHSIDTDPMHRANSSLKIDAPLKPWRRVLYFSLVTTTSVAGIAAMTRIMLAGGLTLLEMSLLVLFAVTFAWIVIAFWNSLIGFVLELFQLDPLTLKKRLQADLSQRCVQSKNAVVMPIYNEDTQRVMAGFEAILHDIKQTGQLAQFDFYLLSDSQKHDIIEAEYNAWSEFSERLPAEFSARVYYRRRSNNEGRKVGNLMDFCERWGSYYDHMIVLDADSLITGTCVQNLVTALEDNPQAGLVQTVPIPVRQTTFFGRFLQFAAVLHSPMLANGLAFWQTDSANYWGHNAIIRISAFMDSCGLPSIPGRGPFSGDILSHDFVEAALLRRAGWHVYLLPNLAGSFEEVPSNLIDYATRDRRWVQGNLQHLALLKSAKLHNVSRLHFAFGAIAYITTLLWLLMLAVSTIDALWRALSPTEFFSSNYQLFPDWPIDNSAIIYGMLYSTAGLLLLPKLFALITTVLHRRRQFGGTLRLLWGALVETAFAVLIAPIMMFFHSYFVLSVLLGHKVGWNAQARDGRIIPWRESLKRTAAVTSLAALWAGVTLYAAPEFFLWLTPVLAGLVLAAPIIRYSSSEALGSAAKHLQLFISPTEVVNHTVIAFVDQAAPMAKRLRQRRTLLPRLLPARFRKMPIQRFDDAA